MDEAAPFSSDYPQRIQLRESCGARPGIIHMHYQLAIAFWGIKYTPFGQRCEYLGDIVHGVEFTPVFENIDEMETAWTTNYLQRELS
jgi:hypothetical protein